MIERVFYASAGGADIIGSHRYWSRGEHNPSEVSITYSGQVEDYIKGIGATGYLVSARNEADIVTEDGMTVEHRVKPGGRGLAFYLAELRYCIGLVRTALRFRADVAIVDSGAVPFFMMALFRLAGIPVVPILHNCLWARGYRPTGRGQHVVQFLDQLFWRHVPRVILAVSPEAERQVEEISGGRHAPIHQVRAQFLPSYFRSVPPPDPESSPFQVMFVGRVVATKGVLDIPEMARWIEDRAPGTVRWTICGRGAQLEALRERIGQLGLTGIVAAPGWTSLEDLHRIHARSHLSIVPTRSGFAEGMAMTAVEAVLSGRPFVSNPIVPALEVLRPAAMAARSNDALSHAEAVLHLATDRDAYCALQSRCAGLQAPFYDRERGLTAVLRRALAV